MKGLKKAWEFIVRSYFLQLVIMAVIALLAYHKIFSFWFYHGWEASWLFGLTGGDFSLINLMKSHGFVSYLNLLLFGWNPKGWFFTALIFHLISTLLITIFVSRLTKNRVVGFMSGLLFIATTADHDVITWGTFESLYAVQVLGFYISLITYYQFRKSGLRLLYAVSVFIFFVTSLLRESGLLFLPVVVLLELIFFQQKLLKELVNKKIRLNKLLKFIYLLLPYIAVSAVYLLLRMSYGGSAHDFIDERVQYRILLFHEHRYLEYAWYGILAFGQYIPPYFIPYPLLNNLKTFVYSVFPSDFVNYYFFVLIGWAFYFLMGFFLWKQRKTKHFKSLIFFFLIFTSTTIFYSFAWTTKLSFLPIPYSWSENRWRYFIFSAFAPFAVLTYSWILSCSILKNKLKTILTAGLVVSCLSINIYYLNLIEQDMYVNNSYPSVLFYKTLKKEFPTLKNNDKFYTFTGSPGLNDFFAELQYIYRYIYPNISKIPTDWIRADFYYSLKKIIAGESIFFVDFSRDMGLKNKTPDVVRFIKKHEDVIYEENDLTRKTNKQNIISKENVPVDFPRLMNIKSSVEIIPQDIKRTSRIDEEKFNALLSFIPNQLDFIQNAKIKVCKTMGPENEPFHHLRPELMIDGNIQPRSYWWADCRPAWVIFDLGKEEEIAGFGWASLSSPDGFPRDYNYETSDDGITWYKRLNVKGNTVNDRIDSLPSPVKARFIRFWVEETSGRAMLYIHEFAVIKKDSESILKSYTSFKTLYGDMYNFWNLLSNTQAEYAVSKLSTVWIPIVWQTRPDNTVPIENRTQYLPMIADGISRNYKFELLDNTYYSNDNQFLNRYFTDFTISFPELSNWNVESFVTRPIFIYEKK